MKRYALPAVLLLFILLEAVLRRSSVTSYVIPAFLACLVFLLYNLFSDRDERHLWETFLNPSPSIRWEAILILSILCVGTFLRFWKLEGLFAGLAWDEAYKGLDAIAIREFGDRPVFLNWNAGREALVAYLVAFSQSIFGYSITAIRAVSAFAGSAAILFFFLFARRIMNQHVALLSTFLFAVSKWGIIHSRCGIRIPLILLFELASLYFLARAVREPDRHSKSFLTAGALTGLGFYTYIAFRIFPVILMTFFFGHHPGLLLRKYWKWVAAGILAFLVVLAPLGIFYVKNKQSFTDRMQRTAVWNKKGKEESAAKLLFDSTRNTLGMFTVKGDSISKNNVAQEPMLSPYLTAFFILGFLIVIVNVRKKYALFLLLYFFFTILPGILTVQSPQSARTLGSLPPSLLITAFGIIASYGIVRNVSVYLGTAFLTIILAGTFYTGVRDALIRYPEAIDSLPYQVSSTWGMDHEMENAADVLNQLGTRVEAYLTPQLYFHASIEYLTYRKSETKLYTFGTNLTSLSSGRVAAVFLQKENANLWWLRDDDGKMFFKWWNQYHQLDIKQIRKTVTRTYESYPRMTRMSDRRLLTVLQRQYPDGRVLDLREFTLFLAEPNGGKPTEAR